MLKLRLKAHHLFERRPMPTWGADLSFIDFDDYKYFVKATERPANSWDDLPEEISVTPTIVSAFPRLRRLVW